MPALAQRRAKIAVRQFAVRQLNLPRADCFPFPRGARLVFWGGAQRRELGARRLPELLRAVMREKWRKRIGLAYVDDG